MKKLSQVQAGPYAYVKSWFLKKYKDEFQQEEETTEAPAKQPDLKLVSNNDKHLSFHSWGFLPLLYLKRDVMRCSHFDHSSLKFLRGGGFEDDDSDEK